MKVALTAALALTVLPLAPEPLRFAVEKADVISSARSLTSTREVHRAELILMGEGQDVGGGSTQTREIVIELNDTFTMVTEDGAPLKIMRSYETLGNEESRDGLEDKDVVSIEKDGESNLTGASVEFTFDPESEVWSSAYADDSGGDEDWLENLAPRVDLARILPEDQLDEETEVGSSWELPLSFLADVLSPGGEVIVMDDPDLGDFPDGGVQITLPSSDSIDREDDYEGDLTATLEEIVEQGDQRLARIVVVVDVSAELDIIDELKAQASERGSEEVYVDATLDRDLEGELTILWDLKNNRPHSVEGELKGSSELKVEWTSSNGNFELELGFEEEADVTHTIAATFGD